MTDGVFVTEPDRIARYEVTVSEVLAAACRLRSPLSLLGTVVGEL